MEFLNKYRNNFKFKYSLIDFYRFKEVRAIVDFIKDMPKQERKDYIEKYDIHDKFATIYWLKIYDSLDDLNDAKRIIQEEIFRKDKLMCGCENLLNIIKESCEKINKPHLYEKIVNTCPNGSSVVNFVIEDILAY